MLLHRLNGNFLPVKDPGGQGGFYISLFKDFTEVSNLFGTTENTLLKKVEITSG
jgi:hypothetical protein